ncbi:allantoin racemase [Phyllobacterium trifolii]|uniref:Allantoin racemase n=1 Tax=Phyllobacterium trifolii TaxID=300193 RepID=A0A839UI62_9HYPH|nr:aspartate/glutamate racemase family protein [Phyllobacterium trifolii]MBB3148560.1 allantoin racemase [Phyllobacterium trifolii]
MKICIINPNTTAAFTTRLLKSASAIAVPGTEVIAVQPATGAASIESHAEEALGALGVMQMVKAGEQAGVDAYVIACFGDTGVHQAREIARGPVIGMTEAALQAASLIAHRFSIVTLPPRTRAHSLRVLHETGLSNRCTVRGVDVPVLELENDVAASGPIMEAEARLAMEQDHAEAIILGCAGLSDLVEPLSQRLGVPVIDGVTVGLKFAEGLVATGLRTSKHSTYNYPPAAFRLPELP